MIVCFIWERNGKIRKSRRERERRHKDMETGTSGGELNRYIGPRGREDESGAVGSGKKVMNGSGGGRIQYDDLHQDDDDRGRVIRKKETKAMLA